MRCGDIVKHWPTGEEWVIAYVDGDYLAWCGWPEGEARVADCTLIKACTDEDHFRMLKQVAESKTGRRARMAQARLNAMARD